MTFDVAILTDSDHAHPDKIDAYTKNVITEDALLLNALTSLGLTVTRVSWDDTNFNWAATKAIIFRTTWDYFNRFAEFSKWLQQVSAQTQLINSASLIHWNIDKHYLLDLKNKGINIATTHFIEPKTKTTLKQLHNELGWTDTVLKPCISGGSRHTYKLNASNIETHEAIFKELIAEEAMMLQPFQHNIVTKGEISMMVFNGQFTHAVLKKAKSGDFRVQDDFGGTVHDYTPTAAEITFAEKTVKACSELPLYARVDIFTNNENEIALAELELIEPELWFRNYPKSAMLLAKAVKEQLQ